MGSSRATIFTRFPATVRSQRRNARGAQARRRELASEQLERRLALAVTTPFTVRYTTNDTGDITFAANTLMTAGPPATPQQIADVQNGVGTKLNNNDFTMTYVDIDTDVTTFNSSSSDLVMPAGSEVLFAGLYWGARTNKSFPTGLTAQRNNVKFMAPGDTAYRDLTGTTIGTTDSSYQSFFDVTNIVQLAEAGTYTTANVQSVTNAADYYAGWSLVVAYRAPGAPARNLTVFDGYGKVANSTGDKTIDVSISGFKAPKSGPVSATLGFITYEGDRGSDGDKVIFDGGLGPKQLSDASNPANNFFNSTISNRGSLVPTKNPNYVNQMGYDANLVTANGVIKNAATSATITLTTGGETYYPGVVTSAIDLFAPEITVAKTVTDENGGDVVAGDVLTYTMTVSNKSTALDAAINVVLADEIPAGTTYKPSSLQVTSGANAGGKSDAADGDQAQFESGTNAVQFQLGTGAGGAGTSGGKLVPGASTTVTFQVTVNAGIPPLTLITNTAAVSYTGETSGFRLNSTAFADIATQGAADLAVTKTDGKTQYVPGTTSTYTIVVTNNGPSDVVGASVVDIMPAGFANPTWTATYSTGSAGPASGSGDIDALVNLLNGGTATFTVTAPIRAETTGNITNVVTVSPPAGVPDPTPGNNMALDTDTFLNPGRLRLEKTVQDLNGGFLQAGDVLRYTMIVRSGTPGVAPSLQEAAANVILTDAVPTHTTFKPGSLVVVRGTSTGSKTDAVDADQGEYINGTNTVQFQLGDGAGAGTGTPVGGTLAAGSYTEVTFDVIVDAGIPDSTVITNTADVTATGATSGLPLSATDTVGIATPPAADLFISKATTATFTPGGTVLYIITVGNSGPTAVSGATVLDTLPAGLSAATWTATYTGGSTGPASGSGSLDATVNLANRGTVQFRITATADADFPLDQTLTNTATVTGPDGIPDPNPDNNTSTVTNIPAALTDLAVTKTDGQTQYVPGKPVTYTIVVTNNGPSFASQASVVDTLDPAIVTSAEWTAVFAGTGSTGSTSGTGSLSEIIDLAPGGTVTYTVIAQTLAGATGSLTNTVTVSTSDLSNDPNPVNNTATDTDTLLLPATLSVAKSVVDVNGGFVISGDTLRYTIVVTNPASTTADPKESVIDVTLDDVIPLFTTYAGNLTSSQGTITGSQGSGVTGTIGTLAAGASATISFDVTVNAGIPDSTTITNTARAAGLGEVSGTELEDDGRAVIMTPPGADLAITKSGPATYVPGSSLTYTLVVTNLGPNTSTNAQVSDALPADLTGATWTARYAGGAAGPASGSGNVNATLTTLPLGGTATFTITATADYRLDTPLSNTATVAATDGLIDPDLDNNTSTVSSTPTPVADLQITKTDGVTSYVPGQQLVYTITVTNAGPSFVTGAVVADVFDSSIITSATWTAAITQGQADLYGQVRGTGSLNQTIDLGPGGTVVYTVTAMTSSAATATLVNTATVTAPAGTTDPTPANNSSTDVDTVTNPAKLTVVKTVRDLNGGVLVSGDTLRYTIIVSNPATPLPAEAATNVILSDAIPANTTYKPGTLRITAGANAGAKTDAVDRDQAEFLGSAVQFQLGAGAGAGTGTPVGGTLSAGQSTTVTFDVRVNAGTPLGSAIINTATATATASVTGVPLQASDSVGISLSGGADLAIVKTAPATYTPGQPLTYTLVVTNAGPSTSTNALVEDVLPAGLTGATWTAAFTGGASGTASGSGNVNTNVTVPKGGRATYTVRATAEATLAGVLTNTATVQPTDGDPDPNPDNNTSTDTSTVAPVADLQIVKTDSSATYTPGLPVTYTITVTNAGPSFVRGATVADAFPATITAAAWSAVYSGTGSVGNAAGTGSINEVIDLAVGGTAVYTVVAETSPTATTSLVNTATVAPPVGTTDPIPANNTSTDTDTVLLAAKLDLTKTVVDVNGGFVQDGDTLRYTIVVTNNSGATLPVEAVANVFFNDQIPANTTYAGNLSSSQGSLTGSQGGGVTGSLGTIAGGQSVTVSFDVTVNAGTPDSTVITNSASATGTGATNGLPLSAADSVGVVTPPGADLTIAKTGPATFTPGGSLTYTLVVTNLGPSNVPTATVADTLPAGLSGATWTVSYAGGAAGPASGSGDINATLTSLPLGGTATFTVTANVAADALSPLSNTATVTAPAGFPDPNPDDNTSTTTSTPRPVTAMSITKTDGTTTYKPGDPVTYTIVVTNAGPTFASQATVVDVLDPAVIGSATWTAVFTGTNSSAQTVGTGSINQTIDLAVGGTVTYTLVAQTLTTATTTLVNTATVTAPDGTTDSATDIDTPTFSPALILGTDLGCDSTPLVRVLDPVTGAVLTQFFAYEPGFRGGAHVYGYDMTGDGIDEIVTAPGPGRPGQVRVFTQTGVELPQYRMFPFGAGYTGGVEVAAGAVTGVGTTQLVAGQQRGTSLVRVFNVTPGSGISSTPIRQLQPFGPAFRGGVTVATADIGTFSGATLTSAAPDGIAEVIVGSGPGIPATVKSYNAVSAPPVVVNTVKPIGKGYAGGVSVAALPGAAGAAAGVLVSAGVNGGSKVETYRGTSKIPAASFAAFGGAAGQRADTWTTAISETEIYSVQGQFGKTPGVKKNTAPSGGTSSTVPGSTSILPPLRIGVIRR
jgi:uncharacterized repeat protein (TIGR01451 family)/fimbrial isopeptide formation D2 family protein